MFGYFNEIKISDRYNMHNELIKKIIIFIVKIIKLFELSCVWFDKRIKLVEIRFLFVK